MFIYLIGSSKLEKYQFSTKQENLNRHMLTSQLQLENHEVIFYSNSQLKQKINRIYVVDIKANTI